ncbi:hypothetical protein EHV15_08665 [Paenibacillus oralis]|uniref:Uncharacterized protein n=1 Tax=Paenibacillus oralis TaxID=2490856 RepID=A0A3P3TZ57_9BACL|nr:hypothetical protein [Paenibacillus oralis]RRJ62986.1 hypothetical protein EHV15_08665 [Paenibacillus oralis]
MNLVKITEICEDPDGLGEPFVLVHDGIRLNGNVAVYAEQSGAGTYLVVERVREVFGGLQTVGAFCSVLFDANLSQKLTIQEIAAMSALELLEVLAHAQAGR